MSKSILFYVDHKHRDLPGLALIGYHLSKIGYKVTYEPLWNWKIANYFDIIIINKPTYKEIDLWSKNKIVIIIETEGANQDISFKRKIQYFPHLYFFWSQIECDKYSEELLINNSKYLVQGSPRLDFFHSPLKEMKKTDIALQVHGNKVITIATSTQEAHLNDEHIKKVLLRRKNEFKKTADYLLFIKNKKLLLKNTTDLIELILEKYQDFIVYLKPHPNENIIFWKDYINRLKNDKIRLFIGQSIDELLKISNLHIAHAACTTIFEANLLKIPTVEMLTECSHKLIAEEHLSISKYGIININDFNNIMDIETKSNKMKKEHSDKFKQYIIKYFYKFDGMRCFSYAGSIDSFVKNNYIYIRTSIKNRILKYLYFYLLPFKSLVRIDNTPKIDHRGRYDNRIKLGDEKKWYEIFNKCNI